MLKITNFMKCWALIAAVIVSPFSAKAEMPAKTADFIAKKRAHAAAARAEMGQQVEVLKTEQELGVPNISSSFEANQFNTMEPAAGPAMQIHGEPDPVVTQPTDSLTEETKTEDKNEEKN